ncbi:hypothetical protein FDH82_gp50 [Roseobacter phage RDJL Phi 2]|uniref:Uncharacterized protein n=1 Tax=Roseobacter phage RDJL Phi 2 TaxID=1682380 RepID=A0A0K0PVJ7_9CAUD|nr:hypothetical protein FDH82_gp50 [Roseobacter phage RDJL Phi 2]AKQ75840.1 hypothetical protein RDJLphi2_gp50 [Roseobacter phage RDJL Phi 2]
MTIRNPIIKPEHLLTAEQLRGEDNLRPYLWSIRLSCAFVVLLGLAMIWGSVLLWVHDRAAQSACESISEQVRLNDGCQQ